MLKYSTTHSSPARNIQNIQGDQQFQRKYTIAWLIKSTGKMYWAHTIHTWKHINSRIQYPELWNALTRMLFDRVMYGSTLFCAHCLCFFAPLLIERFVTACLCCCCCCLVSRVFSFRANRCLSISSSVRYAFAHAKILAKSFEFSALQFGLCDFLRE